MKDLILLKLGEIVLKGLNRRSFEQKLMGNIRRRLLGLGKFKVTCLQSTVYVEAESEDADMRTRGKCWWKEEMPSNEELMNGAENLKDAGYQVNYVLSYEAPAIAKDFIRLHTNQNIHITPLNTYLQELMKSVEYAHWYFGSLHMDLNISKKMTAVFNEIIKIR